MTQLEDIDAWVSLAPAEIWPSLSTQRVPVDADASSLGNPYFAGCEYEKPSIYAPLNLS
jgi:hypothetical protein